MQNGYLDVLNSFRLNEFEYGSPPWPAPFRGLCHDLFKYIIHVRLNNTGGGEGRGLSTEGNIDRASLIVGSKFTIFALFYFVFGGSFQSTSPRGAYIWRGDLMEGFLRYRFGGLIFGGAYTWRGLFSEFYGIWH